MSNTDKLTYICKGCEKLCMTEDRKEWLRSLCPNCRGDGKKPNG